jgi:glycerol uptake facilitator-like aquaporin
MIRGDKATAGVFGTLPRSGNGVWSLLFDQILGTALLLVIVSAVSDGKRLRKIMPENSGAGIVALTVILVGFSLGMNCGYPMNPARDLAPRIFSAMAGYGKGVFQVDPLGYWWISVVGPCIGALLGAGAYRLCIDNDDLF